MSNIASREVPLKDGEGIQTPTVTICLPLKPSVLKKYNLSSSFLYELDNLNISRFPEDKTLTQIYLEASNILEKDFEISLMKTQNEKIGDLKIGIQNLNGNQIEVRETFSAFSKFCYRINFENSMLTGDYLIFLVKIKKENPEEIKHMELILSDPKSTLVLIYGMTDGISGFRTKFSFEDRSSVYQILIREEKMENLFCSDEFDSFDQCAITKWIESKFCPCLSVYQYGFTHVLKNPTSLNFCAKISEEFCWMTNKNTSMRNLFKVCKPNCKTTDYIFSRADYTVGPSEDRQVNFVIFAPYASYKESREYLVYDIPDFIGTIGGSLGLFIGFSFFDFAGKVIDYLAKCLEKYR